MSDEATTAEGGLSMDDAASKIGGLLSGPPPKRSAKTIKTPPPDAGNEPPEDDNESATADAAPEADPQPSGDEQDAEPAEGQEPEQPPIEPPASWTAEARATFATLPRAAQEIIHQRETARDTEVRRMQSEVAQLRKGGDAQAQQLNIQLQQHLAHLAGLADALQSQIADEFADIKSPADLARLAEQDPQRYLRFDAKQKLFAQAQHVRMAQEQSKRVEAEQKRVQNLEAEQAKLAEHPEAKVLADAGAKGDSARAELRAFLTERGFAPEAVAGIEDHRVAALAYMALQWTKAKKSITAAKVTPLPKATLKAGAASTTQDAGASETAALIQRARKTGTLQDAGRAIARLM